MDRALRGIIMKQLALITSALTLVACGSGADERVIYEMEYQERPVVEIAENPTKNAYFGDLHVHTKNSFDAYITGTRTTADDAYRFAKGETIDNGAGTPIKLSGQPLDFYGVTDHGEYMGVIAAMDPRTSSCPLATTEKAKPIPSNINNFTQSSKIIRFGSPKRIKGKRVSAPKMNIIILFIYSISWHLDACVAS